MKAKFAGGPYDLCHFEIPSELPEVRLPFKVTTTLSIYEREFYGQALYKFRHGNDLERVYYFDRLEM